MAVLLAHLLNANSQPWHSVEVGSLDCIHTQPTRLLKAQGQDRMDFGREGPGVHCLARPLTHLSEMEGGRRVNNKMLVGECADHGKKPSRLGIKLKPLNEPCVP